MCSPWSAKSNSLTMQMVLPLDLGLNNPFAQPPPPPIVEDLMDIDLPDNFHFLDVEFNSDHESSSDYIPLPSLSTKIEDDIPLTNDDVDMEDFVQSRKELESEENPIKEPMPSSPSKIEVGDA